MDIGKYCNKWKVTKYFNQISGQNKKNLIMTIGVTLLIQCNRMAAKNMGSCESQSEHLASYWINHLHELTAVGGVSDSENDS